jgi:hypothetical protein
MNPKRLLIAASFLAAIASQACGNVIASATPVPGEGLAKSSSRGGCSVTLSTVVKGFPYATVARADATGCDPADTSWDLATNPDGVVYRVYVTQATLLSDQPSPNGRGQYLKLVDFIASNPVCVEASLAGATARIALLGTTCPR